MTADPAVVDEELDPSYFSWRGWVLRQVNRRDRVGGWARSYMDGVPAHLRPAGETAARAEYAAWYREHYPRSPVARAAAERVAAIEAGRTVDRRPDVPAPPADADATVLLAEALEDVVELLGELARYVPAERLDYLRPRLRRLRGRLTSLRRAAALSRSS